MERRDFLIQCSTILTAVSGTGAFSWSETAGSSLPADSCLLMTELRDGQQQKRNCIFIYECRTAVLLIAGLIRISGQKRSGSGFFPRRDFLPQLGRHNGRAKSGLLGYPYIEIRSYAAG